MKFTLMIAIVFVYVIIKSECVFHLKQINQGNVVMSNSNSNNAGNVNQYTKKAQIVNPHVDFINTKMVDVIKEAPIQIGVKSEIMQIRNDDKGIEGNEGYDIVKQTPIVVNSKNISKEYQTEIISYDINSNTY